MYKIKILYDNGKTYHLKAESFREGSTLNPLGMSFFISVGDGRVETSHAKPILEVVLPKDTSKGVCKKTTVEIDLKDVAAYRAKNMKIGEVILKQLKPCATLVADVIKKTKK